MKQYGRFISPWIREIPFIPSSEFIRLPPSAYCLLLTARCYLIFLTNFLMDKTTKRVAAPASITALGHNTLIPKPLR